MIKKTHHTRYRMVLGAVLTLSLLPSFNSSAVSIPQKETDTKPAIQKDDKSDPVSSALDEIRSGRINQGIQKLLALGQNGNAEANFHLGQIYALGAGRKRDAEKAAGYFRSAARLGHQRAELSLANLLYFEGQPGENYEEAFKIYKSYAMAGEPEAQYVLGMMFWNGDVSEDVDPIRGYALVWLASENGYPDAISTELEMHSQLNFDARREAKRYARALEEEGFSRIPLKLDLVEPDNAEKTQQSPEKSLLTAEDWQNVWHVEVGAATSKRDADRLVRVIGQNMSTEIIGLSNLIVENNHLPGRYKILYGPFDSFQDAVMQCVKFKARGHDCFSRAPK